MIWTKFIQFRFLTIVMFFSSVAMHGQISVDQFGYLEEAAKVAVLTNPQEGYNSSLSYSPSAELEVRNALTDEIVFSGSPNVWNSGQTHSQSGDQGWWFDFSSIQEPGEYYIYDPQGFSSHVFKISTSVYEDVMNASTRMFFYNRCNFEKSSPYAEENWTDGMNFMNALQDSECRYVFDPSNSALQRDLSGGWFDAGDYNKYVTFAESAVHNLLWAYQENPQAFSDQTNIPESGNGIPDVLDELKWELDWLLKMMNPDGSVIIKMGAQNYSENASSPPSNNFDQRFYGNTCTSASLALAGILAHASEVFENFPQFSDFSSEMLSNAETCFNYALPFIETQSLEIGCDNGEIVAGDADRSEAEQISSALIAAVHLLAITENADYHDFIADYVYAVEPLSTQFWGPYNLNLQDALLYYTTFPSASISVSSDILNLAEIDSNNNWNGFFGFNEDDLYRAFMPDWSYHWGSNSPKAAYGVLNLQLVKYDINESESSDFELKSSEQLHYFHGVNPLSKVMLSNMSSYGAEDSMDEIYHGWFANGTDFDNAQSSVLGPAPGFVVGGPNSGFTISTISPPANQPIQKAYKDWNTGFPENSWEISEPAIYYQAIYIRLLANYIDPCGNPENFGCMDPDACNFNENALCDDLSCLYFNCNECVGDFNNDALISVIDLTVLLADYGCTQNCTTDLNEDDQVSSSDLTIFLSVFGNYCD